MRQVGDTIFGRLGKVLRAQSEDITRAQLPRRWVDLTRYLDEQERKRAKRSPETGQRRLPN
jgi:hypothetical protein